MSFKSVLESSAVSHSGICNECGVFVREGQKCNSVRLTEKIFSCPMNGAS